MRRTDVAIIGAGPTGLMTALCLSQFGVSVDVFEKEKEILPASGALAVHARTLEILESLGVVGKFLENGIKIKAVTASFRKKKLFSINIYQAESHYPYVLIIPQNVTQKLLLEALRKKGIVVHWKEEVREALQDKEGVTLLVKNRGGIKSKVRSRYLIDCGGSHSLVRHALNIPFKGKTYNSEGFLLSDVLLSWNKKSDKFYTYLSNEGILALIPLPENKWRILVQVPLSKDEHPLELTEKLFGDLLKQRTGNDDIKITKTYWMSHFRIHKRMIDKYRVSNIFLAGDAAHIHSPVGGQGMNTGMQDGHNLAWKLALVIKKGADQSLLDTYQQERVPVARNVLEITDFPTNLFFSEDFISRFVRQHIIGHFLNNRFIQGRIVKELSELSVTYKESPLSGILPGTLAWSSLRAGDRAPEGTVTYKGKGISLHAFLGTTRFTGLYFTNEYKELKQVIARAVQVEKSYKGILKLYVVLKKGESSIKGDHIIKAPESLFLKYHAEPYLFYLIRPDGYIAFNRPVLEKRDIDKFFASAYFSFI